MSTEKNPPQMTIKAVPLPEATQVHADIEALPPLPTAHPTLQGEHLQLRARPRGEDRDRDSCVFQGRFCFYQACSSNLRYRAQTECMCIRKTACLECCLPAGSRAVPRGVGLVTPEPSSDELCKVAHCCDCALVRPRVLCGTASHVLCLRQAGSLPFDADCPCAPSTASLAIRTATLPWRLPSAGR